MNEISKYEDILFEHVTKLIDEAREHVKTTIDTAMVYTYYGIGQYIVEDEQQGQKRAQYGRTTLRNLSDNLTKRYGKGWSVETLKKCRYFFIVYSPKIGSTSQTQLNLVNTVDPKFTLSWSHYLVRLSDKFTLP